MGDTYITYYFQIAGGRVPAERRPEHVLADRQQTGHRDHKRLLPEGLEARPMRQVLDSMQHPHGEPQAKDRP